MQEFLASIVDFLSDVILFIPRKIYANSVYKKELENENQRKTALLNDYKKRLNAIKYTAERNSYGNFEVIKSKIIELADIPSQNKF